MAPDCTVRPELFSLCGCPALDGDVSSCELPTVVTSVTISVGWTVSVTTDVSATTVDEVNGSEPTSARDGAPETARPFDKAILISTEPAGWGPKAKPGSWRCWL